MNVLGWDIGGAHLKAALVARGKVSVVWQRPCPLWQDLSALQEGLASIAAEAGPVARHALTMTGELADVFPDRASGVRAILDVFQAALPETQTGVYAHPASFLPLEVARQTVQRVASANWSASAAWVARCLADALLVDIGSTTTDLVPIVSGVLVCKGTTDVQRLVAGELIYTGVVRTPVMAMAGRIPFRGQWIAPMAEVFATSADVHRLTHDLSPDADQLPSADGRGKSLLDSARRLGRMLGVDVDTVGDMLPCAQYLSQAQLWALQQAAALLLSDRKLPARAPVVGAGVGAFMARALAQRLKRPYADFASIVPIGRERRRGATHYAPAVSVALLAAQAV